MSRFIKALKNAFKTKPVEASPVQHDVIRVLRNDLKEHKRLIWLLLKEVGGEIEITPRYYMTMVDGRIEKHRDNKTGNTIYKAV